MRGWRGAGAGGDRPPTHPPAARGLLAFPSPGGHGPAFVSDGSIVAPDFSSNCLCQAERPREQSKQEAAAGPKLEKRLLGAPGFREGRAQPTQRRPVAQVLPNHQKEPEAALLAGAAPNVVQIEMYGLCGRLQIQPGGFVFGKYEVTQLQKNKKSLL